MTEPRFTFDSTFPDGSPRRYAGVWRPPWPSVMDKSRTSDGDHVYYNSDRRAMWREGRFDKPLYHIEEEER